MEKLAISPAEISALLKLLDKEVAQPTFRLDAAETRSIATLHDRLKFRPGARQ